MIWTRMPQDSRIFSGENDNIEIPCPVCGSLGADDFFFNIDGECVGCTDCLRREDPMDYYERTHYGQ